LQVAVVVVEHQTMVVLVAVLAVAAIDLLRHNL
jgi:hypothetical protein